MPRRRLVRAPPRPPPAAAAVEAALAPGDVVASREYVRSPRRSARFARRSAISHPRWIRSATTRFRLLRVRLRQQDRARPPTRSSRPSASCRRRQTRYDRQWLARLLLGGRHRSGRRACARDGLTIAAALTVANVVRLALFARRDELEIMELVGAPGRATSAAVRDGGRAAGRRRRLLALALLGGTFFALRARYLPPLASTINISSVHFLPPGSVLARPGGMAVGYVSAVCWPRPSALQNS